MGKESEEILFVIVAANFILDASIEKLFVYYNDILLIFFARGRTFFGEFTSVFKRLTILQVTLFIDPEADRPSNDQKKD